MKKFLLFCAIALSGLYAMAFTPVEGQPYTMKVTNSTGLDLYLNFTTTTAADNTTVLALSTLPSEVYFVADTENQGKWYIKDAPTSESRLFANNGNVGKNIFFGTGATSHPKSWDLTPVNSVDNHVKLITNTGDGGYGIGTNGNYTDGAALWGNNKNDNIIVWEITPIVKQIEIAVNRQNFKGSRNGTNGHYPWSQMLLNTVHRDKAELRVCYDTQGTNPVNLPCVADCSKSYPCGDVDNNKESGASINVVLNALSANITRTFSSSVLNEDAKYYISGYSFIAKPSDEGIQIKVGSNETVTLSVSEDNKFEASEISLATNGFNIVITFPTSTSKVTLEQFTITLSQKPATLSKESAELLLEKHISSIKPRIAAYELFTQDEIDKLFEEITITNEDIADYTDDLASKKAAADNIICPALIANKLNGRKFIIKDHSDTPQFLYVTDDAEIHHSVQSQISYNYVWEVTYVDNDKITLKNLARSKYASGLTSGENAMEYHVANLQYYTGYYALQNANVSGNNYLNTNDANLRYWSAGNGNTSSFFHFIEVTDSQEQGWIDAAKERYNINAGTGLGQFSFDDNTKSIAAQISGMTVESINYPILHQALTATIGATLNPVEKNRLIRIISHAQTENHERYHLTMTENGPIFSTDPQNADIFYYTPNGKLMNIKFGNYIAFTGNANYEMLNSNTSAEHHDDEEPEAAATVDIKASTIAANANNRGLYAIYYGQNNNRCINHETGTGINGGTNDDITTLESNATFMYYFFSVEYVDALPIEFHADNYGSIVSPVGLQIAENMDSDVTVYALSVVETTDTNGNKGHNIKFLEVYEGDDIPAGTTILVYNGSENAFSFNVNYNIEESEANDFLAGHHLTKKVAAPQGKSLYAKVPYTAAENAADAWKITRSPQAPKFTLVRLVPDEEGNVVTPAGAMVAVIEDPAQGTPASKLEISPSQDMPTGIDEVCLGSDSAEAIFDLQGRRLAAPAKGINIINGQKILIK